MFDLSAIFLEVQNMKPLRKILYIKTVHVKVGRYPGLMPRTWEVLECGHRQRPKSDVYGTTTPNRRRCKQCPDKLIERR